MGLAGIKAIVFDVYGTLFDVHSVIQKCDEVRREEVLFLSSNTWDITGASTFGFRTVSVNRKHGVFDRLGIQPDANISDLRELSGVIKV